MKTLKNLFSTVLFVLLATSCSSSSDDPVVETLRLKYQILELDDQVVNIKYKIGNGSTVEVTDPTLFPDDGIDSRSVAMPTVPFTSRLEVIVNNTTNQSHTYTLVVYVDGQPKDFEPFMVPPLTTYSKFIEYEVTQ